MNNEKNAVAIRQWNPRLEQSPAISDLELNGVSGGWSNFSLVDAEKKIIYLMPENPNGLNDPGYRRDMENIYRKEIQEGYILVHTGGHIRWGHQAN